MSPCAARVDLHLGAGHGAWVLARTDALIRIENRHHFDSRRGGKAGGPPALPGPEHRDLQVRGERHHTRVIDHVHDNPVRAGGSRASAWA